MRKILTISAFLIIIGVTLTLGGCGWHGMHGWRGCRYGAGTGYAQVQVNHNMATASHVNVGMRY